MSLPNKESVTKISFSNSREEKQENDIDLLRSLLGFIVFALLTSIILYLGVSFVVWNFNPGNRDSYIRILTAFVLVLILTAYILSMFNED